MRLMLRKLVQRRLELLLARRRERDSIRRYVEGYRRFPETPKEIAEVDAMSRDALAREPWC